MKHVVPVSGCGRLASMPTGIISLGIILWVATATACLLVAAIAWLARAQRGLAAFFLAGGLFSFWLALNDMSLAFWSGFHICAAVEAAENLVSRAVVPIEYSPRGVIRRPVHSER